MTFFTTDFKSHINSFEKYFFIIGTVVCACPFTSRLATLAEPSTRHAQKGKKDGAKSRYAKPHAPLRYAPFRIRLRFINLPVLYSALFNLFSPQLLTKSPFLQQSRFGAFIFTLSKFGFESPCLMMSFQFSFP